MTKADIYFFLGWLKAKGMIDLGYSETHGYYCEKRTGQRLTEIATEYLDDLKVFRGEKDDERSES